MATFDPSWTPDFLQFADLFAIGFLKKAYSRMFFRESFLSTICVSWENSRVMLFSLASWPSHIWQSKTGILPFGLEDGQSKVNWRQFKIEDAILVICVILLSSSGVAESLSSLSASGVHSRTYECGFHLFPGF